MEPEAPQQGTPLIGDPVPRHAEEPQTILGRRRYQLEASPGDLEYSSDNVGASWSGTRRRT